MRRLVKLLMHPYLWIAVLSVVSWRQAYVLINPEIWRVPLLVSGEPVQIEGRAFGDGDGSRAEFIHGGKTIIASVQEWTEKRILVTVPEDAVSGGYIRIVKHLGFFDWPSKPFCYVIRMAGLPSEPYGYAVPVEAESPWPLFRRDHRNTGHSSITAAYQGGSPWSFKTGKGIFSTPVIDSEGVAYFGSADRMFYAVQPDGSERWHFPTGEIIDSAAALHSDGAITFISGDGFMYHLKTGADIANAADRVVWKFDASTLPGRGYINWWEGNVTIGFDGALYAGNTNWNYYAVNPDGTVRWNYPTGNNCWSNAAFGDDGSIYWGSLDLKVRRVAPDGKERWGKYTWGPVAASAAIGSDGTLYIGSFDSYFYALEASSGKRKWTFKTGDHIYSSAALGEDKEGNTTSVYFGSADGILYCLDTEGGLRWSFDTGDPIRSSPALGVAPEGGEIVYFGSGNGKLYALNALNGTRRWSFDTTLNDPELRDRNDLNGSPALGKTGVYITGEQGCLWHVPYDYPLHASSDARCSITPKEDLPNTATGLFYMTSGGTTLPHAPQTIPAATVLTFRLIVRDRDQTMDARMAKHLVAIESVPAFEHRLEVSADGHYVHIVPSSFLKGGSEYRIKLSGRYLLNGLDIGNLTLGGAPAGEFSNTFLFRIGMSNTVRPPFTIAPDRAQAFEWTRLAVSLPAMMPSFNQIGFDSFDCIVSPVLITPPDRTHKGKAVFWMVSAQHAPDGALNIHPKPEIMTPLNARYYGDQFIFTNQDFSLNAMNVRIPLRLLDFRAQFSPERVARPGATAYAEADILSIPTYGPMCVLSGLGTNAAEKLVVSGTFITRPYDGGASMRPQGIRLASAEGHFPEEARPGMVRAQFEVDAGATYHVSEHRPAVCLIDRDKNEAVFLDYTGTLNTTTDIQGNLSSLTLTIPPGTALPPNTQAVILLDAFGMGAPVPLK